ncbi:uncharacterized protein Z520_06668 [Fonsecaea multimorphosa CBS 102226]|uniref:Uncharacterized protein n=1 Tax=Fonsecaea multimorphosa CBS 102226 TaxID=1442371 RepID=A0A0D2H7V4_9EURO|nr:uncharacterized protein Z520_06668 [Fonsecaea multimorphosa CBS 102226]KIX97890.1 hypothetical protein Z520_06668 [Fonsecaea multimorphosa CBS 102226]OAL23658.1 hypothetical protein AYO22_06235 [Fonsecaea multimorphosa]
MPAVTRPVLPPLQTPKTASFPSEIVATPISCVSAVVKQENANLSTPITPPVAYTEFLKALTPVLASPPVSSGLQRSMSDESTCTRHSLISNGSTSSSLSSSKSESHRSPASSVPPTPYSRKTPTHLRRLRIPHSPAFSPSTSGPSPRTALSGMSTGGIYSPFSPADWNCESATRRYFEAPRSACSKSVNVRSVVTRTVTYKRSPPLDPAPKGKKRKTNTTDMPPPPSGKDLGAIKALDFPSTLIESQTTVISSPSASASSSPTVVTTPPTAVV